MDESEIEKIVERTLESSRDKRIHKIWKNPENARSVALLCFMVAFMAIMGTVMFAVTNGILVDPLLVNSLLEEMNCDSLKEISKMPDLSIIQENLIQKYLLAECL